MYQQWKTIFTNTKDNQKIQKFVNQQKQFRQDVNPVVQIHHQLVIVSCTFKQVKIFHGMKTCLLVLKEQIIFKVAILHFIIIDSPSYLMTQSIRWETWN